MEKKVNGLLPAGLKFAKFRDNPEIHSYDVFITNGKNLAKTIIPYSYSEELLKEALQSPISILKLKPKKKETKTPKKKK